MILRQGTRAEGFFLIEEGRVAITSPHAEHEELGVPTAILGPGDYFGEITMLHEAAPKTDGARLAASVHAVEPCRLRVLRRTEMLTLIEVAPAIAAAISDRAVGRMVPAERASVTV